MKASAEDRVQAFRRSHGFALLATAFLTSLLVLSALANRGFALTIILDEACPPAPVEPFSGVPLLREILPRLDAPAQPFDPSAQIQTDEALEADALDPDRLEHRIAVLTVMLKDGSVEECREAILGLRQTGQQVSAHLAGELQHFDLNRRQIDRLVGALEEMDAVEELTILLSNAREYIRFRALQSLRALQQPAIAILIDMLTEPNAGVRFSAASLLGGRGDAAQEAVPSLAELLDDSDHAVRHEALWALGRIGGELGGRHAEEVSARLAELLDDPSVAIREAAAAGLADVGPPAHSAVPALARLLRDPDSSETLQHHAARALGRIGPAAASSVPHLIPLLTSNRDSIRRQVAFALGAIGPKARDAVPALIQALADPELLQPAAEALGNIGPGASEALPILEELLVDLESQNSLGAWTLRNAIHSISAPAEGRSPC